MRMFRRFWAFGMLMVIAAIAARSSCAQQYKMSTPIAPGVVVPDKIESSIGILKLSDGYSVCTQLFSSPTGAIGPK